MNWIGFEVSFEWDGVPGRSGRSVYGDLSMVLFKDSRLGRSDENYSE